MPYKPAAIANYFLELAKDNGESLTPMKVQKLVYFAHGWFLAITGKNLIDEQVEAWKFGPVIPSLYQDLKRFGSEGVSGRINKVIHDPSIPINPKSPLGHLMQYRQYVPTIDSEDVETKSILDQVWDSYSHFTGIQLSNMTHEENSPWGLTIKGMGDEFQKGTDIPQQLIKSYFENKMWEPA